jgi:hypothetical protein
VSGRSVQGAIRFSYCNTSDIRDLPATVAPPVRARNVIDLVEEFGHFTARWKRYTPSGAIRYGV